MKNEKKFRREDAVEVARRQRQLLDAVQYLEELTERFDADWRGRVLVHEAYLGAATVYNVTPDACLFIIDISDKEPVLVNRVRIERVELLETAPGMVEPIITDVDDVQHTQPSLGLTPDYDTGKWGELVPVYDSPLALTLAMQWLLYEYGERATGVVDELSEHLENEHGALVMTTADYEVAQKEATTSFSC